MPPIYRARLEVARAAVTTLAAFLFCSSAVAAQPIPELSAPEPVRMALRAAWQQHPSYRATEAQLAAARARLDAAGQPLYNPELELSAEDEGPDRTATVGLALTLDLSGKRRTRRAAEAARFTGSEAQAALRRRDYVRQWLGAWVDLRTAGMRLATGPRRLALVNRFAELAERQFTADDISGLDRDVALLARDEAEAEQAALVAERAEASARFLALGGNADLSERLQLPDVVPPAPMALSEQELLQLPEWRIAEAEALAAEREVAVAQRNRIPDPTVGVRGGRIDYGGLQDDVFGVAVSIPLPVRNSYRAEVVAARAEAEAADAESARLRGELIAQGQRVVESFAASRQAWSRWKASRGTDVERRAELLERLWREGELSTSDYLLQLNQTLNTQLAGAALEAQIWRNYFDYLAASGQLEHWAGLEATP